MNLREIGIRAGVTAVEGFLAAVLAVGLTGMTVEAAELAALSGLGAGLSVIYNAARSWLDRSSTVRLVRALRAERRRHISEGR